VRGLRLRPGGQGMSPYRLLDPLWAGRSRGGHWVYRISSGHMWLTPRRTWRTALPGRMRAPVWQVMTALVGAGDFNGNGHLTSSQGDGPGQMAVPRRRKEDGSLESVPDRMAGHDTPPPWAPEISMATALDLFARGIGQMWLYPGDGKEGGSLESASDGM
jgi:hypothetical protein